ncbi:metallophosphoesterase [Candidatus Woesearchaeota archaeon]|nr:metallophosphoesterase [Candidatus Woesearchaeota archaeon]
MVYAVISDVHANIEALQAVLAKLLGIDEIHCIGDIVGYGPNPDESCDAVKSLNGIITMGNHDAYVSDAFLTSNAIFAGGPAGEAIDASTRGFSEKNRAWLKQLPAKEYKGDAVFAHGNPSQAEPYCITEYILLKVSHYRGFSSTDRAQPELLIQDRVLFRELFNCMLTEQVDEAFIGHSHLAFAARRPKEKDNTSGIELIMVGQNMQRDALQDDTFELELDPNFQYVFNPGSVGQPRDLDRRASCLVRDGNKAIWHRVMYDPTETIKKMEKLLIDAHYRERLKSGK